ncbi:MAG TPA: hypothetical protein VIJ33_10290 [Solirubrobacteraceae bacterium]
MVAAPGVLSEVSFASAQIAARLAGDWSHGGHTGEPVVLAMKPRLKRAQIR